MHPRRLLLGLILSAALVGFGCAPAAAPAPTAAPAKPGPAEQGSSKLGEAAKPAADAAKPAAGEPISLKLSYNGAPDTNWGRSATEFEKIVERNTNGRVKVQNSPFLQLGGGNNATAMELIQSGELHMTYQSPAIIANYDPKLAVIALPFVFPTRKGAYAFIDSPAGQSLATVLDNKGILIPAWGEQGYRELTNSKRAIRSPEDLKGLRFRVPESNILLNTFKTLGADPVIMAWNEALTAFQTGAVDGQENPVGQIWGSKLYETQKHLTMWGYSWDATALVTSKKFLEGLPADVRPQVDQSIKELAQLQRQLAQEDDKTLVDQLKEKGMEVIELTPEQKAAFQKASQPIYDQFTTSIGKDLVDQAVKAGQS